MICWRVWNCGIPHQLWSLILSRKKMIPHQIMGALFNWTNRTPIQSYSHGISKFLLLAYFNDRPPFTSEAKSCGHLPTAHSCHHLCEWLLNALLQGLCGSCVLHVGEPHLRQWLRLFCIPIYLWFIWHICNLEWPPGFQNDKLRHLEWMCFDCHVKCLKPAKIHIIRFPTKILDFTVFWWHFLKKRLSKPKSDDLSRLFSLFCSSTCYPFDGHAKCMKPAKTHTNWLATLLQPQKSGSNCLCKI